MPLREILARQNLRHWNSWLIWMIVWYRNRRNHPSLSARMTRKYWAVSSFWFTMIWRTELVCLDSSDSEQCHSHQLNFQTGVLLLYPREYLTAAHQAPMGYGAQAQLRYNAKCLISIDWSGISARRNGSLWREAISLQGTQVKPKCSEWST